MGFVVALVFVAALAIFVVFSVRCWGKARTLRTADWGARWLNVLDGFVRDFCLRYHRMKGDMLPLPESGGAIVVANHVSGLDPLLLIASSRRPLRFIIAREEYERFGLRWLFRAVGCIPIDRDARPDRALRTALRALADGEVVALFPQGGIHIAETPALLKRGVARLAQRSGALVYPAHIDGVRGAGQTLLAVLMRSRAHMRVFEPFPCSDEGSECLEHLSTLLHKSQWVRT